MGCAFSKSNGQDKSAPESVEYVAAPARLEPIERTYCVSRYQQHREQPQEPSTSNGHAVSLEGDPNVLRQSSQSDANDRTYSVPHYSRREHPPEPSTSNGFLPGRRDTPLQEENIETGNRNHPQNDANESGGSNERSSVAYNKISVREPLAKVLAERAAMEHHYAEVEDERLSSFYEEIAGSTDSSVTYMKIGEVEGQGSRQQPPDPSEPIYDVSSSSGPPAPPSVASLLEVAVHSRAGTSQNGHSNCAQGATANYSVGDLYSYVDKSRKSERRTTAYAENIRDLYAKVQKSPRGDSSGRNPRLSSPAAIGSGSRGMSPPATSAILDKPPPLPPTPPPPPPVPSLMNLPRSSRAISMYNSAMHPLSNHQRRHSSDAHPYSDEISAIEDPGYEVVRNDDFENEPGYEEVGHQTINPPYRMLNGHRNGRRDVIRDDEDAIVDPGYETVHYPESRVYECEPAYEVISKPMQRHDSEVAEPGYEVIKRPTRPERHSRAPEPLPSSSNGIARNESDLSNEPGYERVRYVRRQVTPEFESEPTYASIIKYDIEEGFSERL